MALTISSSFDAGNIRVTKQDGGSADLEIVHDHMSDFYQWFYFRVSGSAGRELTLRITNCAGSAYPNGWPDYKAVMSLDREEWLRVADPSFAHGGRAAQGLHLPCRPQHEPRRLASRPPSDQRGRRQPQPRVARAVGRKESRGAVRPQCDGQDRRRFRDGYPR